jgi:hypothetical protein
LVAHGVTIINRKGDYRMSERHNRTRYEAMLGYELYRTIPYGQQITSNPRVIVFANALGRSANSVQLKMQNLKSYNPHYTASCRVDLIYGCKLDNAVVGEFIKRLKLNDF